MKILHVITGLENGGAETILFRLVTGDKNNKHEVISLLDYGFYGELLKKFGIKVHTLNMSKDKFKINSLLKLYFLIRNINPDVIQTWMYHANLIGGFSAFFAGRKKVVWGIHHSDFDENKTSRSALLINRICSLISETIPKNIVYCSEYAAKVHMEIGYSKNKSTVIHNGVDVNQFEQNEYQRNNIRAKWNIKNKEIALGMIARWDLNKDHHNLIAAFSKIKSKIHFPWKCILVGKNMDDENIELITLLKKYDIYRNVILLGLNNDIPAIMNALDLHILSSSAEAFGNTTIEAMSCGIPAIVTAVGAGELIVGDTGWVVPSSDSSVLGETILKAIQLMEDQKSWGTRKSSCRARVIQMFSLEQMINSYHKVWLSSIG